MEFHKLVRDRIEKIIRKQGKTPIIHTASDDEYYRKLKEKLHEEVNEFVKSNDLEELADLLQVIYSVLDFKKIPREKLEELRRKKNDERGKFNDRVILDEIR